MNKLELLFSNLKKNSFSITSRANKKYNCIAWTQHDTSIRWWPPPPGSNFLSYYWPHRVPRKETIDAFVQMFSICGFNPCNNTSLEKGYEKVALYVSPDGRPKHAARQLPSGLWTSKLGKLQDIEHKNLECLECNDYGTVQIVLKKKIKVM